MSEAAPAAPPTPRGWQPLTFGGVASFASASLGRLLLVELIVAILVSISVVWFVHRAYCPVFTQAIGKLPDTANIYDGQLHGLSDNLETGSKFLVLAATPEIAHEIGQGADLQIQLRQHDICAVSVFRPDWGLIFPYDQRINLSLSPTNLGPWWGAWQPMLLAGTAAGVVVLLMAVWVLLATVYAIPAKMIAWLGERDLSWNGAWKLAGAALMPGGLIMVMAVFLYGWQGIDLTGLSFFFVAHLITGWIFLTGGVLARPRLSTNETKGNPFVAPSGN
jgi:hypothetical protein